jgi:predicted Zn-dependent peptidase
MKFSKKVLKNGLTVLHEKRDVPVTTVMLGAKFGSAYESEEEKGIAHFIEHLCFKGTKKRSAREIAFELEKVGGILNAFTSEEETAYHVKLPSNHLELAMDVIFDIFFNPIFPEADVKKEANVICEEIRMYHDNPRAHVIEMIKKNLYEKPFGMFIAGSEKTVRGMTRDQLLKKHDEIYVPSNSILSVVGNNDFEDVVKFAEKFCPKGMTLMSPGEGKSGEIDLKLPEIKPRHLESSETRKELQQANVVLGFHFPTGSEKERYAAAVFSAILGQGMSSRLFTEVREKRGLVYTVRTESDVGKNYSYLLIYAGTDKEKVKEVLDICLEEFGKMKGLTKKELDDGKAQVIGNYHVGVEGSNDAAVNLLLEEIMGDAEEYYKYEGRITGVSLSDIKKLAGISKHSSFVLSS